MANHINSKMKSAKLNKLNVVNNIEKNINTVSSKAKTYAKKQEDIGSYVVAQGLDGIDKAIVTSKALNKTQEYSYKSAKFIGKETKHVARKIRNTPIIIKQKYNFVKKTTQKAIKTVKLSPYYVRQVMTNPYVVPIVFNKYYQKQVNKVIRSNVVRNIRNTPIVIKQKYNFAKKTTQKAIKAVKLSPYYVRQIVTNPYLVPIVFSKYYRKHRYTIKRVGIRTIKGTGKIGFKTVKSTTGTVKKVGNKAYKGTTHGLNSLETVLNNSDDIGSQAIVGGIKSARVLKTSIKSGYYTGKFGTKTVVTSVQKTTHATKTVSKGIYRGTKFLRKNGIKKTSVRTIKGAVKGIGNATVKVSSFITKSLTNMLIKLSIPLVCFVLAITFFMNIIIAPVGAVANIFGGIISFFTGDGGGESEEINEHDFLLEQITEKRNSFIEKIENEVTKRYIGNGGEYQEVKVANIYTNEVIEGNDIYNTLPSVEEYTQMIQGIFHTIMLSEYELEPTERQMHDVLNEIWSKVTLLSSTPQPTKYCNDEKDGLRLANSDCVNKSNVQYHTTYHSSDCDSYICKGHYTPYIVNQSVVYVKTYHNTVELSECGNYEFICNGYYECDGHKTLYVTIGSRGIDDLLDMYFISKIDRLTNKDSLTEKEKERLTELEENYEFCIEYMNVLYGEDSIYNYVDGEYVGGNDELDGTTIDIEDVTGTVIATYAKKFLGNPYVWGGNSLTRGVDCSGFVKLLYEHHGIKVLPRTSKAQSKVGKLVSYSNAKVGDLIFYEKSGVVNHVAMYIGNGKIIHASNPKDGIKISNALYRKPYCIRRIIN